MTAPAFPTFRAGLADSMITLLICLGISMPGMVMAQGAGTPVIAWLSPDGDRYSRAGFEGFTAGLRNLGLADGRNIRITPYWAMGSDAKLEQMARAAVRSRPAIIVTQTKAVFQAKAAGADMPVVFGFSGDPVVGKLVSSLARPGGNYTGVSLMSLELVGMRMQVLKELLPQLRRVGVMANPGHPGEEAERHASEAAARQLGLEIDYHPVRNKEDVERALEAIARAGNGAILLFPDNGTLRYSKRIADFSKKTRIPAISGWAEFADRGNLASYGPDLRESYGSLSGYVDKILKGAKPGELPVQLPSRVELVVNLKTARAIGLKVPRSVLLRANRVIE